MQASFNPAAAPSRRNVIAALGCAVIGPLARGQQPGRQYRIGWLGASPRTETYNVAFVDRLRELGFTEGRNLVIEHRTSLGRPEAMPALAAELARAACDVIFIPGSETALNAIKSASRDTPIVILTADFDPVAAGHVTDLARPGGRVTGVSMLQTELPATRLQVLKELLPRAKRVGVLADVASTGQLQVTRSAAALLGLDLVVHQFNAAPYDYPAAFATFRHGRAEAMLSLGSSFFVSARKTILDLASLERLPSVFGNSVWADGGGLLSYGPNFSAMFSRAADLVAKILNGSKASEMPVEQPNIVEMVINLNTARTLGVTVPQAIRLRADRIIE